MVLAEELTHLAGGRGVVGTVGAEPKAVVQGHAERAQINDRHIVGGAGVVGGGGEIGGSDIDGCVPVGATADGTDRRHEDGLHS